MNWLKPNSNQTKNKKERISNGIRSFFWVIFISLGITRGAIIYTESRDNIVRI